MLGYLLRWRWEVLPDGSIVGQMILGWFDGRLQVGLLWLLGQVGVEEELS